MTVCARIIDSGGIKAEWLSMTSTDPFLRLEHRTPQSALAAHAAIAATIAGYPLLESMRTCHVQTAPSAPAMAARH